MTLSVVVLNDFCYVQGGASKVALTEAIALAEAGIDVTFLGAVGPAASELLAAPLTVECLDHPELLDARRRPVVLAQALWNAPAARRAAAVFARLPPGRTVVHLHGYTKALTTSPVREAQRAGLPVVCTLHDFFAACPNGAFYDYRTERPCLRRALSPACVAAGCDKRHYGHKLYRVARSLMQRHLGQFPQGVQDYILLSERSRVLLAPYLPASARYHRLANLIDIECGPPVDPAQNRLVLCVGRLDAEKGVRLLARAATEAGLGCVFVGDGPLRAELEALPGVVVTGWLSHELVRDYLLRARCVVFPSLWYETYGLVVSEAEATGVPAIVSDISAAAERVVDGVTGWIFRSGDAGDLARCLRLIFDDERVAGAGARAYRAYWATAATPSTHAAQLVGIYERMLDGRGAADLS